MHFLCCPLFYVLDRKPPVQPIYCSHFRAMRAPSAVCVCYQPGSVGQHTGGAGEWLSCAGLFLRGLREWRQQLNLEAYAEEGIFMLYNHCRKFIAFVLWFFLYPFICLSRFVLNISTILFCLLPKHVACELPAPALTSWNCLPLPSTQPWLLSLRAGSGATHSPPPSAAWPVLTAAWVCQRVLLPTWVKVMLYALFPPSQYGRAASGILNCDQCALGFFKRFSP